jgi:hypothetical protein
MSLYLPIDADLRWKCEEKIKDREGNPVILITESLPNGTIRRDIAKKVDYILAEQISDAINNLSEIRDAVNYENRFMISDKGDLISKITNKILSQTKNDRGYLCHATRIDGREGTNKLLRIHRVVAEAFIPNPENKPQVNHIDGIKINNPSTNLEWNTGSENTQHAYNTGLAFVPSGPDNPNSILSHEEVAKVKELYNTTKTSERKLAKLLNVSRDVIRGALK